MNPTEANLSRYLVQLTRAELVQVFAAVKKLRGEATHETMVTLLVGILHKLAQSQQNGPVPLCEIHQVPMVRMKGTHGHFWSCHIRNEDDSWCDYRPPKGTA
jgi:hypothetical protein